MLNVDSLRSVGLSDIIVFKSIKTLPRREKPTLLVLHVDDFISDAKPIEALEALIESLRDLQKSAIMVLNPERRYEKFSEALPMILKFYGYHNITPTLPIEPYYAEDKLEAPTIDCRLLSADAVVFQ